MPKTDEPMNLSQAAYDFSLECAAFRARLWAELSKRADAAETRLLSDEELTALSAAGWSTSYKP